MLFGAIAAQEIEKYWPICREILLPSFRDVVNPLTVDDYYIPLKTRINQLWAAINGEKIIGAAITSVDCGSAGKVCMVHSIAGEDMKSWISLFDEKVTQYARDNECFAIQAVTRKGFTKIFPDLIEDGIIFVRLLK